MVGPDSYGIPRAPHYLGGPDGDARVSLTGLSPSSARFPNTVPLHRRFLTPRSICGYRSRTPATPNAQLPQDWHTFGLGSTPFAHHYLGHLFRFLFLRLLRCFTSPGRLPLIAGSGTYPGGLPHSDIHGSRDACSSPWLFAACCVFRRHLAPRHPPRALYTLTS